MEKKVLILTKYYYLQLYKYPPKIVHSTAAQLVHKDERP